MKQKLTLVLIIAATSFLKINSAKAQVNVQDSLALVDLYNSTNGAHWYSHTNWLTSAPVSTWHGVTVTLNRVTSLYLYGNQLTGSLPSSMGNLINLDTLDLTENEISGPIPVSFSKLSKMTFLSLDGSGGITGNISFLTKLPGLQVIDLAANQLSGKIPALNNPNLSYLCLGSNQLSGSIPTFGKDTASDITIILEHNNLTGSINHQFDSLAKLSYLTLNNNQLTGRIPTSLNKLINLTDLDLSYNQFSGKIPSLNNLKNLWKFNFSNNQLTGKIPSLDSLKSLSQVWVSNNQLSGNIPDSLDKNANLTVIDLSNNNFSGTVPLLNNLNKLYWLTLENNQFTFAGMENIATTFPFAVYSPQANIHINKIGNRLSVSAGGTLANNTYNWYKNGVLYKTKIGNSSLILTSKGAYYVTVTNSVATALTLYSDTINYLTANNLISDELNIENTISPAIIYPNPAKTNATLSFNADGKYAIIITDVSGKILQTRTGITMKGINTIQLDVSKYVSGIYLITIVDEKNRKQILRLNKE